MLITLVQIGQALSPYQFSCVFNGRRWRKKSIEFKFNFIKQQTDYYAFRFLLFQDNVDNVLKIGFYANTYKKNVSS